MKYSSVTDESGFTLIEVIVAIVLVASLSGIMIVFLSDSLVKSSQSIVKLKKVADLNKVMVNIMSDYKKTAPSLPTLQGNINAKNYGTYDVVENKFIQFDGSDTEILGGSTILKVTIKNDQGETLTTLFISN